MNRHPLLASDQPINPVVGNISYVRLDRIQVSYQLRRSPVQRHITQYITSNIHILDPFVGKSIRLRDNEFARPFVEVVRNLLCLVWRRLQHS
jgi:hypothetical protein